MNELKLLAAKANYPEEWEEFLEIQRAFLISDPFAWGKIHKIRFQELNDLLGTEVRAHLLSVAQEERDERTTNSRSKS